MQNEALELCKCPDHLIRRYFIKTVHFVYTGSAIFGKQSRQVEPID